MFGERLRSLRKSKKMTQEALAKQFHVSQQTVASWEKDRTSPKDDILHQIADYFEVSTDYLFGRDIPDWATKEDVLDLEEMLNSNANMSYGGENLTDEEKQRVKDILTGIFWEKLEKRKRRGADA